MNRRVTVAVLIAGTATLVLFGCQNKKETSKEAAYCTRVVRVALSDPQGFKVKSFDSEETSEGTQLFLRVAYRTAGGKNMKAKEECWFDSLKKGRLTRLYLNTGNGAKEFPKADLARITSGISG